jgi:hypothetical protein
MRAKKMLFYLLTGLLGGCVPIMSLNPLYTAENLVFEEKLLGTWVDDPNKAETTWEFRRLEKTKDSNDTAYQLLFTDNEGKKGSFVAHLLRLDGKLFLDAYPSEMPWEPKDPNKVELLYNTFFLIPARTFLKIDSIEPTLKIRLTNEDKMKDLLKENPTVIQHTTIEKRTVFTASTKELQKFVLKYADDERVFTGEINLIRKQDVKK